MGVGDLGNRLGFLPPYAAPVADSTDDHCVNLHHGHLPLSLSSFFVTSIKHEIEI